MDYLVTMDTGDKFLMHHGVKGMKWGKWNAETAARYAGGSRSNRTIRMTSKAEQHRRKANEFRAKRDKANTTAVKSRSRSDKLYDKSDRAEQGAELFRNANQKRADRFERKADIQRDVYENQSKASSKYNRKYSKADKKATRYEVKAYKSDADDSSLGPERKTVRDLKKHRISMDEAKARTEAKVKEALEKDLEKSPQNQQPKNSNQHWKVVNGETLPMNSYGWTPGSYSKKDASDIFGKHADTYIRKNIDTYEELASKYNRDNKKDLATVLKLEEKALADHEYLSDFGTREQAAKAAGKYDAYSDWRRSGTQADFDDWYDRRMY